MSRFGALAVLGIAVGLAGCAAPPHVDWSVAVTSAELAEAGLDYHWQNSVPLDRREEVTAIWHLDENVYCLTSTNRVFVFDALTGEYRWSKKLAAVGQTLFAPAHVARVALPPVLGPRAVLQPQEPTDIYDLVIFNTVTTAFVFDRTDGTLLTQIDFGRLDLAANTGTVSDGTRVFVGSVMGRYTAMELVSGVAVWGGRTEGMISASPELMGERLYLASHDGGVHAIEIGRDAGTKRWPAYGEQQTNDAIVADFVVDERGVFVGSTDYNVYALDPITGEVTWRFRCMRPVRHRVQAGATNVYAFAEGDSFYAIDLATGARAKWALPEGRVVLTEVGDRVYVLSDANAVMVVDAAVGTMQTVVPLTGLNLFVPNTTTEAIYAASRDGRVTCLRPRGTR